MRSAGDRYVTTEIPTVRDMQRQSFAENDEEFAPSTNNVRG